MREKCKSEIKVRRVIAGKLLIFKSAVWLQVHWDRMSRWSMAWPSLTNSSWTLTNCCFMCSYAVETVHEAFADDKF